MDAGLILDIVKILGPWIGGVSGLVITVWYVSKGIERIKSEQRELKKDFYNHSQNEDLHYDFKAVSRDFVPRTEYGDLKIQLRDIADKLDKLRTKE